jgi:CelD/BcsL family acetyltransferase involved in cellulose biosynthesis
MVTGDNGLAGIAPLVISKQGSRDRIVRFLGDGRSDYCDFLTGANREAALAAMLNAVFSRVEWDMIELNNVPSESRTIPIVQSICERAGFRTLVFEQFLCRALVVEGREESARAILNKPSLRRPTNFFQRAGRLACRDFTRADEIEPYLDRFFEQHVDRWSGTHSSSLFLNERNRAFYQALTRNLSPSGVLLFSVIELDGAPIAFHYGFDRDGVVIWYKPSFDIKHAAHSPGLVLMRHLIDYAVNGGRRELDFTVGDEAFKRRFTNQTRTTVCLRIFRRRSGYVFEQMRHTTVQAVKRAAAALRGGRSE